jgi:hypothetical protein
MRKIAFAAILISVIAGSWWLEKRVHIRNEAERQASQVRAMEARAKEISAFMDIKSAAKKLAGSFRRSTVKGGFILSDTFDSRFVRTIPAWHIECGLSGVTLVFEAIDLKVDLTGAGMEDAECLRILPIIAEAVALAAEGRQP